jgi:hypothetical protein
MLETVPGMTINVQLVRNLTNLELYTYTKIS